MTTLPYKKIISAIEKIDPGKIKSLYPDQNDKEFYEDTKEEAILLLKQIKSGEMTPELNLQLEAVVSKVKQLCKRVNSKTELGGRARLNEIVIWAESQHLERAIYLAGVAKEIKIKEPYKTQISVQPANACMVRYRQLFQISEWVSENLESNLPSHLQNTIDSMFSSLLYQFHYFSSEAYSSYPEHSYAAYMKALAYLFLYYDGLTFEKREQMQHYLDKANEIVQMIPEPSEKSHYVELQYHKNNYAEFITFERISKRNPEITGRLKALADRAESIDINGGGIRPNTYFAMSPFITAGARAASVVGVLCGISASFGIDLDTVKESINTTWGLVANAIPEISASDHVIQGVASHNYLGHTGGLAENVSFNNMKEIMVHTGGLV